MSVAVCPASRGLGVLETHGVLMGWKMKLPKSQRFLLLLQVLYHQATPPASNAFSIAITRWILAKRQSEPQGLLYFICFQGKVSYDLDNPGLQLCVLWTLLFYMTGMRASHVQGDVGTHTPNYWFESEMSPQALLLKVPSLLCCWEVVGPFKRRSLAGEVMSPRACLRGILCLVVFYFLATTW